MNWLDNLRSSRSESKELVREVHEKSNKTFEIVREITQAREAIENDPLPNFPISGFLVGAAPRVIRRGVKRA